MRKDALAGEGGGDHNHRRLLFDLPLVPLERDSPEAFQIQLVLTDEGAGSTLSSTLTPQA